MEEKRSSLVAVAIVAMLALPVLYVGSYYALVDPGLPGSVPFTSQPSRWRPCLKYRIGGNLAEFIFWPVEQIDQRLRPDAWDIQKALQRKMGPPQSTADR